MAQQQLGGAPSRPADVATLGAGDTRWQGIIPQGATAPVSPVDGSLWLDPADPGTASPTDFTSAQLVVVNAQTAAYALALADANKAVEVTSSSGVAVTVPTNATAPFPIGTVIEVVQTGAGQITITPASGVTINSSASLITRTQWATVALRKRGADLWILAGDTQ